MMVGVVGGKEQLNAECGPAVDRVAVVVGGEEQPNTPERCSGWWQSSTERSGGDGGVVCKKEGYLNPLAPRR